MIEQYVFFSMAEMSVTEMSIGRYVRGRNVRGRNVLAETSVAEMSEHRANEPSFRKNTWIHVISINCCEVDFSAGPVTKYHIRHFLKELLSHYKHGIIK